MSDIARYRPGGVHLHAALVGLLGAVLILFGACSDRAPSPPQRTPPVAAALPPPVSLAPETSPSTCSTLCVTSSTTLVVDKDGGAAGELTLCNRGADTTVTPRLSDFHVLRPRSEDMPLQTVRTLSGADGKPFGDRTALAKGVCVVVKVQVAKIFRGGLLSARFANGEDPLAEVKAVRREPAFRLRVDAATPEKVDVTITRGKPGLIQLRNEDPEGYAFAWVVELRRPNGVFTKNGAAYVGPQGRVTLSVELKPEDYSFFESGFLRGAARTGRLVLDYEPDPSFSDQPRAQQSYPISARLDYFGDPGQRIWNYVFVLILLLAGIVMSILINYVLPTQRTRVDVRQRLADLDGRLAGLSATVDSRLLSLLRVEKRRLGLELRHLWPVFPTTAVDLPKLAAKVDLVAQRIDLTVQAGQLLDSVRIDGDRLSVQEVMDVCDHCAVVFGVARKPVAADGEVKTAQQSLLTAAKIFNEAEGPPAVETMATLRTRADRIKHDIDARRAGIAGWTLPEWSLQSPPFNGPTLVTDMLAGLVGNFPDTLPAPPTRADYVGTAKAVRETELLLQFAQLVETAGGPGVRDARLRRLPDLLAALRAGAEHSIDGAANIVRQTEENVTRADVENAMRVAGEDQMWIEKDPPTPLVLQLVIFRVRFAAPGLDTAAARHQIEARWTIGGEVQEGLTGWLAGAFFEEGRGRLRNAWRNFWEGNQSDSTDQFVVEALFTEPSIRLTTKVKVERAKSHVESRTMLALLSLFVTVIVVGLGLLAGAQEKLQTLDWLTGALAVLVLGYTANAVKNLITKS